MLPARQEEELDALLAQALSEGALTESAVDEITDSIARGSRGVGGLIQELRPRLRTPPPKAPNRKARRAHLQQHGEVGGGGGEVGGLMAEMEALLALAQDTSGGHDSAAVGEGDEAGAFDMSDVLRDVPSADGEGDGLVEGGVEGIGAGGVEGCGEEGGGGDECFGGEGEGEGECVGLRIGLVLDLHYLQLAGSAFSLQTDWDPRELEASIYPRAVSGRLAWSRLISADLGRTPAEPRLVYADLG